MKIEDILENDAESDYNVFEGFFSVLFCTRGSSALCLMLIFCGCCEVKPQYSENVGTNFHFTLIVVTPKTKPDHPPAMLH